MRTDNNLTLCKIRFNLGACKTLSKEDIDSLSDTARNFLLLSLCPSFWNQAQTQEFCKYLDGGR